MKVMVLIIGFSCSNFNTNAQKVYQNGNYPGQYQRGYEKVTGILNEKYSNKGFNWFLLNSNGQKSVINVVSTTRFNHSKTDSLIVLDSCFLISSRKWKRN